MAEDIDKQINQILSAIDLSGWMIVANGATPLLQRVMAESGAHALAALNVPGESQIELTAVVNEAAAKYAAARGAEMIGMRLAEDGALVENPNPRWAITESTRDMLRSTVQQALEEGWSSRQLATAVEDGYAFSPARASMIGRTEIARASEAGTLSGWRNSGVVESVIWELGSEHDDDVPAGDECDDNSDAGPIPIGEAFPSGDDAPPGHPNCVCSLSAVLKEEA